MAGATKSRIGEPNWISQNVWPGPGEGRCELCLIKQDNRIFSLVKINDSGCYGSFALILFSLNKLLKHEERKLDYPCTLLDNLNNGFVILSKQYEDIIVPIFQVGIRDLQEVKQQ